MVAKIRQRFDRGVKDREPFARDWVRNIHYYAGAQNIMLDSYSDGQLSLIRTRRRPKHKTVVTENRILPLIQTVANMLIGNPPEYECIPGPDQADRQACELGERLLVSSWDDTGGGLEGFFEEYVIWLLTTGIVGVGSHWDPDAGSLIPVPELDDEGQPLVDPTDGSPIYQMDGRGKTIWDHEGDVGHTLYSANQFIPEPNITRPRDLHWYIYHSWFPMDRILEKWPDTGKAVTSEGRGKDVFTQLMAGDYFGPSGWRQAQSDGGTEDPGCEVLEFVVKPCDEFPMGALIHTAGTVLLDRVDGLDEDCLDTNSLGMIMSRCWPIPGRFWPTDPTSQMISTQDLLNDISAQIFDAIKLTAYPKRLVPHGARIKDGAFSTSPNEIIQYTPGLKPENLEAPQMPNYVLKVVDSLPSIMMDLIHTHEVSTGRTPANIRSGTAIGAVQDSDQAGWGITQREIERAIEWVGRRRLWLMKTFYALPRQMKIIGEDRGSWEIRALDSAELAGVQDVKVVKGSSTRRSKAQARQQLTEILGTPIGQMIASSPMIVSRVLEAMDLGHITEFTDLWRLQSQNARRVLRQIEESGGQMLPAPEPWEDHPTYLRVIGDDLMSAKTYERMQQALAAGVPDPIYTAKKTRWLMTWKMMIEQQMAQAAAEQGPEQGGQNSKGSSKSTAKRKDTKADKTNDRKASPPKKASK